ncbi:hypothetical protein [uncultured Herbaspirillum sp.]|uniref:hypothetical protein n=1 Tax=uncultured Herbaspirillum sp. TaxID=160236 RepID=UPI00258B5D66|nr:hypothetical protein [uncultured Herbaspirillum sp.]
MLFGKSFLHAASVWGRLYIITVLISGSRSMTPQEIEEIYGSAKIVGIHNLAKKLVFRSFTNSDIESVNAYQR